jgi:hypothetical protein
MAAGEGSGATGNSARLGLVRIRDGLGKGRVVAKEAKAQEPAVDHLRTLFFEQPPMRS